MKGSSLCLNGLRKDRARGERSKIGLCLHLQDRQTIGETPLNLKIPIYYENREESPLRNPLYVLSSTFLCNYALQKIIKSINKMKCRQMRQRPYCDLGLR